MLLRGKDLPDGSETVRACMARQQGTLPMEQVTVSTWYVATI